MRKQPRSVSYPERIREETRKFCFETNVPYERAEAFVEWIIWYAGQRIKKEARDIINEVLK